MSTPAASTPYAVIVGLGITGLSCARYLLAQGWRLAVTDTRAAPPELPALRALGPDIPVRGGALDAALLEGATCVAVSPGLSPEGPFFAEARRRGLGIIGDIELFARAVDAPVAGVTGTNGKSTVTTLLARMAERAGVRVRAGGNLGEPALALLGGGAELYVLELSSFPAAKARIYERCETAVINLDDPLTVAMPRRASRTLSFSLRGAGGADYTLSVKERESWLARSGAALMPLAQLRIKGLHNAANALAALALGEALSLPLPGMLEELAAFPGLPHSSQWVADVGGVTYIDDSKGTNVGATLAAVAGLPGPLVMIAGGEGKNQDFAPLALAFRGKVRHAVLIGRDAPLLARALAGVCPLETCATLPAAVRAAAHAARPGDTVLLSPACASLDMFRDYSHRGAVFAQAVQELAA